MRTTFAAATLVLALGASGAAFAEPVKVGMITTLSGGGAGLGVDARDGFMLAIKLSGSKDIEVVTEDDAMKPELAVQIADKMIQSDKVDMLTGIIWSNLAMAVVPNAVAQGNSTFRSMPARRRSPAPNATRTTSTSPTRTTIFTRRPATTRRRKASRRCSSSRRTILPARIR